jgi:hypothetical protein
VSLAQCLKPVIVSLLADQAVLTLDQLVNLSTTTGANAAMRVRDLQEILLEGMRAEGRSPSRWN